MEDVSFSLNELKWTREQVVDLRSDDDHTVSDMAKAQSAYDNQLLVCETHLAAVKKFRRRHALHMKHISTISARIKTLLDNTLEKEVLITSEIK